MIVFFALVGMLCLIGLVLGLTLYVMDWPEREDRLRIEADVQQAAWRIQRHTRRAVEQMLDAARERREHDQS